MEDTKNSSSSIKESLDVSLFWNILEESTNSSIPIYIKNIFKFSHLDQPVAFKSITEDTLKELETFAQEEMINFLNKDDNLEIFYGQYHEKPEKFRFMIGDKLLIRNLVTFVQSKSETYWKLKESSIRNSSDEKTTKSNTLKKNPTVAHTPDYDVNGERKQVMKLAKAIVVKKCPKKYSKDIKKLLDKIDVEISVSEVYNDTVLPEAFSYKANIQCPLCVSVSKIKKCGSIGEKGCRWVLSNFDRHMKKHENEDNQNMNTPRKSVKIADKLKQFANNSDRDQSLENTMMNSELKMPDEASSPSTSESRPGKSPTNESNTSLVTPNHSQINENSGEA